MNKNTSFASNSNFFDNSKPNISPKTRCMYQRVTYGTIFYSEVKILRNYRETKLKQTDYGKEIVKEYERVYYKISPKIVHCVDKSKGLEKSIRWLIVAPMIYSLRIIFNVLISKQYIIKSI